MNENETQILSPCFKVHFVPCSLKINKFNQTFFLLCVLKIVLAVLYFLYIIFLLFLPGVFLFRCFCKLVRQSVSFFSSQSQFLFLLSNFFSSTFRPF